MEYDSDSTALIVVDMQNDFCHPDGALYAEGSEEAIDGVNEAIQWAESEDIPIWYTQDTHQVGDDEFEQWGEHCLSGEWGWDIHEDVARAAPSNRIYKDTYDAFHDTMLHGDLDLEGVETVIICGTLVNVCVQETASSAVLHGYDVGVVEDAVGYISDEQREAALNHIDFLYGETVALDDL